MVVAIDADLRVRADFREFFLLFFLLLFFLLAGITRLTSDVNFVDLQHGFHHAPGAGGIGEEGSDIWHGTPGRRKSYQPEGGGGVNGEDF